ncbi:MAG: Hpt domain-containing protein, partial [Gallionella sp.]
MIEDNELRNLFRIESCERLQHLDDGLLQLEKTPTAPSLLEDLFREAHSLKGASRMLGLDAIQTMAHQLEDALGAARKGEAAIQPETVAQMYQTLETIRELVKVASEEPQSNVERPVAEQSNAEFGMYPLDRKGLPSEQEALKRQLLNEERKGLPTEQEALKCQLLNEGVGRAVPVAEATTATLLNAELNPEAVANTIPKSEVRTPQSDILQSAIPTSHLAVPQSEVRTPQSAAPQSEVRIPHSAVPQSSAFRIETIRVEPKKLDALLTQAGELTVTKIRIARHLTEV